MIICDKLRVIIGFPSGVIKHGKPKNPAIKHGALVRYGGFHEWGYPKNAGWFSSGKNPHLEMDDEIGGYPYDSGHLHMPLKNSTSMETQSD